MYKSTITPTNSILKTNLKAVKNRVKKEKETTTLSKKLFFKDIHHTVHEYIANYVTSLQLDKVALLNTRSSQDIVFKTTKESSAIINLRQINDYRRINHFFEEVNKKLAINGLFINNVETHEVRKERILKKIPKAFKLPYYILDFTFHRVFPKVKFTKKFYYRRTKGYGRVLSKSEILGRLYSAGFEIVSDKTIDGKFYFVAKKVKEPAYDTDATYGPLIYLKRVGKGGKIIKVAKIRTMHPYAEYLQQYVFNKNNLKEGGKIKNDFRISKLGKLFRKYWIDEIPMFINLLRGEMKIIGVRPLSKHYFDLYPDTLQSKRTLFKPGLLPPFYADMPKTLNEIADSEMRYLTAYEKEPLLTDIKYFMKIVENIVWKGKRSA